MTVKIDRSALDKKLAERQVIDLAKKIGEDLGISFDYTKTSYFVSFKPKAKLQINNFGDKWYVNIFLCTQYHDLAKKYSENLNKIEELNDVNITITLNPWDYIS